MAKRKKEVEEKPVKKPKKTSPEVEFSICIPSTIISSTNACNLEQITNIAYQVARAATIYNVVEIIVLDIPSIDKRHEILESQANKSVKIDKKIKFNEVLPDPVTETQTTATSCDGSYQLFENLLQYFITPPYLVKSMFKNSKYLPKFKYAMKLPKLSTLPFMNNNDVIKDFKEGLSIPKKSPGKKSKNKLKTTKFVNIGGAQPIELSHDVPVNVRVTVDTKNKKIVSPTEAYGVIGAKSAFCYYTRSTTEFNQIFTKSAQPDGYTSSIYVNCDNYFEEGQNATPTFNKDNNKVLLVFGNPKDFAFSLQQDKQINVPNFTDLFDQTISLSNLRIEDALMITLTKLNSM